MLIRNRRAQEPCDFRSRAFQSRQKLSIHSIDYLSPEKYLIYHVVYFTLCSTRSGPRVIWDFVAGFSSVYYTLCCTRSGLHTIWDVVLGAGLTFFPDGSNEVSHARCRVWEIRISTYGVRTTKRTITSKDPLC